ncbi:hypothetical protein [Haloplanus sp.]|uniref:hypothetical protein n=1 Tax=Haloplanus sp. TaxID=1961696 RepID=UPI002615EB06|nr:hypothetical protein [Haloplanus sp.]
MHRRALLSACVTGLTATAGCLGVGPGSDCQRGADLRLNPVTTAAVADRESDSLDTLSPPERDAVSAARRGDASALWATSTPLSGVDHLAADGTYYTVTTSLVSTVERTGYALSLDTAAVEDTPATRRIALDDLPDIDRTALYVALGFPGSQEIERFDRARSVAIGGTLVYPDDARSRSDLVPDPSYETIRIGDRDFRLDLGDPRPTTVETHRVAVGAITGSAADFAGLVFDRYGVELDPTDLSAEQRDIVEAATDDGYDECAPYSDAYTDLQATLGRAPARTGTADGPVSDTPARVDYVDYESDWYAVSLAEYVA